jgi:hypothetical protein
MESGNFLKGGPDYIESKGNFIVEHDVSSLLLRYFAK